MRRWALRLGLLTLLLIAGCVLATRQHGLVLYAQTVPAVLKAQWSPNAAGDNVLSYALTLDGGSPVTVTPTLDATCGCIQALVTIPNFGNHTVVVSATNLLVSTDPNSGQQSGAPTTVTFSLNRSPSGVGGVVVKK